MESRHALWVRRHALWVRSNRSYRPCKDQIAAHLHAPQSCAKQLFNGGGSYTTQYA